MTNYVSSDDQKKGDTDTEMERGQLRISAAGAAPHSENNIRFPLLPSNKVGTSFGKFPELFGSPTFRFYFLQKNRPRANSLRDTNSLDRCG